MGRHNITYIPMPTPGPNEVHVAYDNTLGGFPTSSYSAKLAQYISASDFGVIMNRINQEISTRKGQSCPCYSYVVPMFVVAIIIFMGGPILMGTSGSPELIPVFAIIGMALFVAAGVLSTRGLIAAQTVITKAVEDVLANEINPVWTPRGVTFRLLTTAAWRILIVEVPAAPMAVVMPVQQMQMGGMMYAPMAAPISQPNIQLPAVASQGEPGVSTNSPLLSAQQTGFPSTVVPSAPAPDTSVRYCTKCGKQNSADSAFCGKCGNKL